MAARSISTTSNLGFGRFAAAGGGAITVGITGARKRSGTIILLASPSTAAAFRITGNDNKTTILTLPANGTASLSAGASQMPLINFVSSLPGGGVIPSGQQNVTVGATLQVAPNQAPGTYAGAFQAIIEYQ